MTQPHLPIFWRYRICRLAHFKVRRETNRLFAAWAQAEGGTAANNPFNTTQPWPRATLYNRVGVRNYATGRDGIHATVTTLLNGHYRGIVADLQAGRKTARRIVSDNAHEFDVWGTGAAHILRLL